jgi:acyl-CoA hydrolase
MLSKQTLPGLELRQVHIVFPNDTNHLGTLFGGKALAWMDQAAFIAASRFARKTVVTVRSESVDFKRPVQQGDLAELCARVVLVGTTSMTVDVELWREVLLSGERELATRGRFVMVASA